LARDLRGRTFQVIFEVLSQNAIYPGIFTVLRKMVEILMEMPKKWKHLSTVHLCFKNLKQFDFGILTFWDETFVITYLQYLIFYVACLQFLAIHGSVIDSISCF
jgi:hypothetical protein